MVLMLSGAELNWNTEPEAPKKFIFVFIGYERSNKKKNCEYYLLPYSLFFYHFHQQKIHS